VNPNLDIVTGTRQRIDYTHNGIESPFRNIESQAAIALKLVFSVKLLAGGLVGKIGMSHLLLQNGRNFYHFPCSMLSQYHQPRLRLL
jgi:hypothetical protein